MNTQVKPLLYRWFGLGKLSSRVRPVLESEDIVLMDEGMPGSMTARRVKGPWKYQHYRWRGFYGNLVITKKRIIAYAFWTRQINVELDDERISKLFVDKTSENAIDISFQLAEFRDSWQGEMSYRFYTEKADDFMKKMIEAGVSKGTLN